MTKETKAKVQKEAPLEYRVEDLIRDCFKITGKNKLIGIQAVKNIRKETMTKDEFKTAVKKASNELLKKKGEE